MVPQKWTDAQTGRHTDRHMDKSTYIVVQQSTTVSLTGLPVLKTLYKPMSMHKSIDCQNCEFCVL